MAVHHGMRFQEYRIYIIYRPGKDSVYDIVIHPFIKKNGFDTLAEKILHFICSRLFFFLRPRQERKSHFHTFADIPVDLPVCQNMDGADRLAAERKGILRTGRNQSAKKRRRQIVQLI